jgi:hypothetical protein
MGLPLACHPAINLPLRFPFQVLKDLRVIRLRPPLLVKLPVIKSIPRLPLS